MARQRQGHISPAFRVSALPIADCNLLFCAGSLHCVFQKGRTSETKMGLENRSWSVNGQYEK